MRKKSTGLFMLLATLLVVSCNHSTHNEQNQEVTSSEQKTRKESIALNNGEKWKVNSEMKPFIDKSQTILDKYVERKEMDYKTLANQLKGQNSALIKSCTMQGQSHDELHKWLHPHMELIKELEDAQDPEEAKLIVSRLEKSFETYNQYFK